MPAWQRSGSLKKLGRFHQICLGAARPCWSDGIEGDDAFMKFGWLSSRCKSYPINAEPGRSVASLARVPVTGSAKRRHASVWATGYQPRNITSWRAQAVKNAEGKSGITVEGEGMPHPAG